METLLLSCGPWPPSPFSKLISYHIPLCSDLVTLGLLLFLEHSKLIPMAGLLLFLCLEELSSSWKLVHQLESRLFVRSPLTLYIHSPGMQ